jgi:hypothetical protein
VVEREIAGQMEEDFAQALGLETTLGPGLETVVVAVVVAKHQRWRWEADQGECGLWNGVLVKIVIRISRLGHETES